MIEITPQERQFLDRVFGPTGTLKSSKKKFKDQNLSARVVKIRGAASKLGKVGDVSQVDKLLLPFLKRAQELAKTDKEAAFDYLNSIEASLPAIKKHQQTIAYMTSIALDQAELAYTKLNNSRNQVNTVLEKIRSDIQDLSAGYQSPSRSELEKRYLRPITQARLDTAHAFAKTEYQRLNGTLQATRTLQGQIGGLTPHLQSATEALVAFEQVLKQIDAEAMKATDEAGKAMIRTVRLVAQQRLLSPDMKQLLLPSGKSVKSSRDLLGEAQT